MKIFSTNNFFIVLLIFFAFYNYSVHGFYALPKDVKELKDIKTNKNEKKTAEERQKEALEISLQKLAAQKNILVRSEMLLKLAPSILRYLPSNYYLLIEELKNEIQKEETEKLTTQEVESIYSALQELINRPIPAVAPLKLKKEKTFAYEWIDALTEQARGNVFNKLVKKIIPEIETHLEGSGKKIVTHPHYEQLEDILRLTDLLKDLVSESDLSWAIQKIRRIAAQSGPKSSEPPLLFGPKTEVLSIANEMGGYSIVSAEPAKIFDQILAEEQKRTLNKAVAMENAKKRLALVRASNPSVDAFFTMKEKGEKYLQKKESEKLAAINIIIPQWQEELDQDTTCLDEQINILKRWARIAYSNPRLFYENLEKVKKNFQIEIGHDEIDKTDEDQLRKELEILALTFMRPVANLELPQLEKTFASSWIDATTQEERDQTIQDLFQIAMREYNRQEKNEPHTAIFIVNFMINLIYVVEDLISKDQALHVLQSLRKIDKKFHPTIDQLIIEISANHPESKKEMYGSI